jgi:hypothetical protein
MGGCGLDMGAFIFYLAFNSANWLSAFAVGALPGHRTAAAAGMEIESSILNQT